MTENPKIDVFQRDEQHEEDDDPLTLECWSCGNEWESGALGYVVDDNQRLASEACTNCGMHMRTPPLDYQEFETVAWGAEDHPQHTLGEDEVRRRLPAIDLIFDDEIKAEVVRLSANAPAYFWMAPAASPMSDNHHPLCRETSGLWAHTLMLLPAVIRLEESYREQGRFSAEDRDHAIAAAILHDQRKRGPHGTRETTSVSDHELQMARVIEEESDLPQDVADPVASHMGPWYDGPTPETDLEDLIHTADMIASTSNADLRIPGPVPEELEELGLEEGDF